MRSWGGNVHEKGRLFALHAHDEVHRLVLDSVCKVVLCIRVAVWLCLAVIGDCVVVEFAVPNKSVPLVPTRWDVIWAHSTRFKSIIVQVLSKESSLVAISREEGSDGPVLVPVTPRL